MANGAKANYLTAAATSHVICSPENSINHLDTGLPVTKLASVGLCKPATIQAEQQREKQQIFSPENVILFQQKHKC